MTGLGPDITTWRQLAAEMYPSKGSWNRHGTPSSPEPSPSPSPSILGWQHHALPARSWDVPIKAVETDMGRHPAPNHLRAHLHPSWGGSTIHFQTRHFKRRWNVPLYKPTTQKTIFCSCLLVIKTIPCHDYKTKIRCSDDISKCIKVFAWDAVLIYN